MCSAQIKVNSQDADKMVVQVRGAK